MEKRTGQISQEKKLDILQTELLLMKEHYDTEIKNNGLNLKSIKIGIEIELKEKEIKNFIQTS